MRKKLIVEKLVDSNPHIIAFQAVARHPDMYNGKDQAFQICEQLNGFQSHYFEAAQTLSDGLAQGNAVISKFPITEKSFQMLTLTPALEDTNNRILLKTTFQRPGGKFNLYNAHFSWVHEQAERNVTDAMRIISADTTPSILTGDLNTLSDSSAFQSFNNAGFIDAWQKLYGNENGFTFESDKPSIRIDYFWLAPTLIKDLNKVEVLSSPAESNVRFSDHLGLMLELNINV
jgi:endonuclease/exonuclease/phosphatase family metal-dependent hydrolase